MKRINKSNQTILMFWVMVLCFCSCGGQGRISKELEVLKSQKIELPSEAIINYCGKDTLMTSFLESELKLVVYSDSLECTSCGMKKMHLWGSYISYSKAFKGRLSYCFIFSPAVKDLKVIRHLIANSVLEYPVIIDEKGEFEQKNPHLPKNSALHTFLLDENNNVILVGNPLYNKSVEELFYKEVEKRLGKGD